MSGGRLARAAGIVLLFGLVSRLLGFARELVLASAYGTSGTTDAFVNSLLIVNSVAAVLLYTLVTLIIPVFQQERAQSGESSAWRLIAALGFWVGLLLVAVSALVAIWPEAPAALFNLDPERERQTADLIRIMAPALALQGVSALFTAMLQIHGRFAGPAAVGVAFNLGIIVGIAVGQSSIGIEAAGWGVMLGAALQVALQLPEFVRLLRRAEVRPAFMHPRLAGVGALALPVLGASVLQQINNFTDKLFASSLDHGKVAALNFASALGQAPRVALLLPLLTPLFPHIARLVSEGREEDAVGAIRRTAGLLALVAVPIGLLMSIYSDEVTQLAFKRNQCGNDCVAWTAGPLLYYALALWPAFLNMLFIRSLSAANRQRAVLWTTLVTVALTIVLDIALLGPMEQSGLALAATIAVAFNTVMLLFLMRHHFPRLGIRRLGRRQARVLVAVVPAVVVAFVLNEVLPTADRGSFEIIAPLLAKVCIALAVYLAAARLLARDELDEGLRAVRSLRGRRRGAG
ncbi:MAG: murein biosynthesis integral membrane protein MurJ [Thermoleophilia bacterium]